MLSDECKRAWNFSASSGAFLWDEPDQDHWSKTTRIMEDQVNNWIFSQSEFAGLFDASRSEWFRITYPDPGHPNGTHPSQSMGYFALTSFRIQQCDWKIERCFSSILEFYLAKTSPCFDLFVYQLMKQITNTLGWIHISMIQKSLYHPAQLYKWSNELTRACSIDRIPEYE